MRRRSEDTTAAEIIAAYEAIVALGDSAELRPTVASMRAAYQRRTGAFGPEDPWFETRARAFWDDALATQGFAAVAAAELGEDARAIATCVSRSQRGFYRVREVDDDGACLVDAWSGAEFLVRHIDDTQALALEHADGAMDARVTAGPSSANLYLLPGAYHHSADAFEPAMAILRVAAERGMQAARTLDALMRMDLVLRSSSRVKASFAYRIEALDPPLPAAAR